MTILQRPAALVVAALIIGALIVLGLLTWRLGSVIVLFFGAITVATVLRSLSDLIRRILPLSYRWSTLLAGLLIAALIAGFVYFLGARIGSEYNTIVQQLPQQISNLGDRLGIPDLGQTISERAQNAADGGSVLQHVAGYTSSAVGAITDLFLVIAAGIYLAAEPQSYRSGFLLLLPKSVRGTVGVALEKAAAALRLWLLGQFIAMILVGVLTTAGLYLIGVRSALALGLFSALAEFIPIVGPVVSGVAAVLVALSQGGDTVLWVIALFIVVQQIEGNVVMPIVQRRTVELPPVLQIFALVVFGILFHLPGIVLGTPLAVVAYVAVKQLYVRDLLHEPVHVPGDHIGRS